MDKPPVDVIVTANEEEKQDPMNCSLCFSESQYTGRNILLTKCLLNQFVSEEQKSLFRPLKLFEFCSTCAETVEELRALQTKLDKLRLKLKVKGTELKYRILKNSHKKQEVDESEDEEVFETFRRICTRDYCPRVQINKNNKLYNENYDDKRRSKTGAKIWKPKVILPFNWKESSVKIESSNAENIVEAELVDAKVSTISCCTTDSKNEQNNGHDNDKEKSWERPSLSYLELCLFAILTSEKFEMTLRDIILFIEDTFPYYKLKTSRISWRENIRLLVKNCNIITTFSSAVGDPTQGNFTCAVKYSKALLGHRKRIRCKLASQSHYMNLIERIPAFQNALSRKLPHLSKIGFKSTLKSSTSFCRSRKTDNPWTKPPFSLLQLSVLAIMTNKNIQMSFCWIIYFISKTFPYYKDVTKWKGRLKGFIEKSPIIVISYRKNPSGSTIYTIKGCVEYYAIRKLFFDELIYHRVVNYMAFPDMVDAFRKALLRNVLQTPVPSACSSSDAFNGLDVNNATTYRSSLDIKPSDRPRLSYIELCLFALMTSKNMKLKIEDIYDFIEDNFPYYKLNILGIDWRENIRLVVRQCKYIYTTKYNILIDGPSTLSTSNFTCVVNYSYMVHAKQKSICSKLPFLSDFMAHPDRMPDFQKLLLRKISRQPTKCIKRPKFKIKCRNDIFTTENEISMKDVKKIAKLWARPPLSIPQLCALAILSSDNMQAIVADIYAFIAKHFPYYKDCKNWEKYINNSLLGYSFIRQAEHSLDVSSSQLFYTVDCASESYHTVWNIIWNKLLDNKIEYCLSFPDCIPVFRKALLRQLPEKLENFSSNVVDTDSGRLDHDMGSTSVVHNDEMSIIIEQKAMPLEKEEDDIFTHEQKINIEALQPNNDSKDPIIIPYHGVLDSVEPCSEILPGTEVDVDEETTLEHENLDSEVMNVLGRNDISGNNVTSTVNQNISANVKPFLYKELTLLAILTTDTMQMKIQDIYDFIEDNFSRQNATTPDWKLKIKFFLRNCKYITSSNGYQSFLCALAIMCSEKMEAGIPEIKMFIVKNFPYYVSHTNWKKCIISCLQEYSFVKEYKTNTYTILRGKEYSHYRKSILAALKDDKMASTMAFPEMIKFFISLASRTSLQVSEFSSSISLSNVHSNTDINKVEGNQSMDSDDDFVPRPQPVQVLKLSKMKMKNRYRRKRGLISNDNDNDPTYFPEIDNHSSSSTFTRTTSGTTKTNSKNCGGTQSVQLDKDFKSRPHILQFKGERRRSRRTFVPYYLSRSNTIYKTYCDLSCIDSVCNKYFKYKYYYPSSK